VRQIHRIEHLESRLLFARPYGVDVSYYQTTNGTTNIINWSQAKASGIEFALIRSSYGNASADTAFVSQASAAKAANVLVGAYHFAYPDGSDAITEANNFMNRASAYMGVGSLPPVLDMENNDNAMTNSALTTWANDFANHIYNTIGVKPYIYCNSNWATNILQSSVNQWPLWIANYGAAYSSIPQTANPPTGVWPSNTWKFYQYTSTGSISGYTGNIDKDVFNGDLAALQAEAILDREVTVLDGPANIADGQTGAISFGTVNQNASAPQKTFTVRNDGDLLLNLSSLILPVGFTIVSNFGDTSLVSGQSTTFTVNMLTSTGGVKSGNIQFTTNDGNETTFNFPVTGTVNGLSTPTGLQVTGSTYNSVSLGWTDTSASETSFRIERKTGAGGTYAEIGFTPANTQTYTDLTAPGGSQLYYRARAYDGTQYSSYATEVNTTTPVQTPPNFTASDNLNDKIALTWTASAGSISYQVFRGTVNDSASSTFLISTTQLSFDDTDAIGNITYYYFIRGISGISTASAFSAGEAGLRVVDTIPPTFAGSAFSLDTSPQQVRVSFSEDVAASLDVNDVTITRLSESAIIVPTGVMWEAGTSTAVFALPANIAMGNYHVVVNNAGIKDPANNTLIGSSSMDFYILPGDANRDRKVDTLDFNILAEGFGAAAGKVFSTGDFSLDSAIDSVDFGVLLSHYGMTVPIPSAPLAALVPAPSLFAMQPIEPDPDTLLA